MAGQNRTQAEWIADQATHKYLGLLDQAPGLLTKIQELQTFQAQQASRKAPSVFKSGNLYDNLFFYTPNDSKSRFSLQITAWGNLGLPTVYVFSLEDADRVRIAATLASSALASFAFPIMLGYAFSPEEQINQIPITQFSGVQNYRATNGTTHTLINANDEIPCAGNRFMHVFFEANNIDVFQSALLAGSTPAGGFTYQLIK